VSELPLDNHEWDAFASHFYGVSVRQLMRREPSAHTRCDGRTPQLGSGRGARPLPTSRPAVKDTEQRADRELDS
jgi:hypothetical protein